MTLTYKQLAFNGSTYAVMRSDGVSFMVPKVGEDERSYLSNPDYAQFKVDGGTAAAPDVAPKRYTESRPLVPQQARTTGTALVEIFRAPVPANTVYKAFLTIWGVTDDLANFRAVEATVYVGRATGAVAILQTRVAPANATIRSDHETGNGDTWPMPTIAVDNTLVNGVQRRDVVISVAGLAATGINWLLTGGYETFTPAGV